MSGEVDLPGIEGRVITGGIAQTVERDGDLTRIRLTRIPGAATPGVKTSGPLTTIKFPEPVTIDGGGFVTVEMDWLPAATQADVAQPMHLPNTAVATTAYVAPSVQPGHVQGAISG